MAMSRLEAILGRRVGLRMGLAVGHLMGFSATIPDMGTETQVMTRTHVILPDDIVAAIDELVGQRGRSSFLADAAREAIKRRRLKSFLASSEAAWKSKDHPELAQGASAFVRGMRDEGEETDILRRGFK
jgi:hypothetical protein